MLVSPKQSAPAFTSELALDDAALPAGRYRCEDVFRFPLGNNYELVYSKQRDAAHVIPSDLTNLLLNCRTFKTLAEHAADACRRTSQDRAEALLSELSSLAAPSPFAALLNRARGYAQKLAASEQVERERAALVRKQLWGLAENGLLMSEAELLRSVSQASGLTQPPPPIATVCVVTRDRVDCLKRCLISYIENGKKYGRTNDYVVTDDSESVISRNHARSMLSALKSNYGVEIAYAGREEKSRFAEALIHAGDLPAEMVDFALFGLKDCGCVTGANRNALLLHNAGDMFFCADDDTICRISAVPEPGDGLALDSRSMLMEFWFFSDREAAIEANSSAPGDLLALHEQLLGKALADCVAAFDPAKLDLNHSSVHLLQALPSEQAKVVVTFNGLLGDSGMQSSFGNMALNHDSHARLVNSTEVYHTACTSREALRMVTRHTISDNSWCMSTALAFDNRDLLPPFLPVQRNQDGLWGLTLRRCLEDGCFGHLPWALLHAPPELRSYPPREVWSRSRTSDVIAACISSFDFPPNLSTAADRISALGRYLMDLGEMAQSSFEELVRVHLCRMQSSYISALDNHLHADRQAPSYWATNFKTHLSNLRQGLADRNYIVPFTLIERRSSDEARKLLQSLVYKFGQVLYWWPWLMKTACDLRARGQTLAESC